MVESGKFLNLRVVKMPNISLAPSMMEVMDFLEKYEVDPETSTADSVGTNELGAYATYILEFKNSLEANGAIEKLKGNKIFTEKKDRNYEFEVELELSKKTEGEYI